MDCWWHAWIDNHWKLFVNIRSELEAIVWVHYFRNSMSCEYAVGVSNQMYSSGQFKYFNELWKVVNYKEVVVPLPFKQTCANLLPWQIRQRRRQHGFCSLSLICAAIYAVLNFISRAASPGHQADCLGRAQHFVIPRLPWCSLSKISIDIMAGL